MRSATLLCFLLLFSATLAIPSQDAPGVDVADLKDQLKNGLRVRRPGDLAFIDTVVEQVEMGRLPLPLTFGHLSAKSSTFSSLTWVSNRPISSSGFLAAALSGSIAEITT